MSGFHIGNRLLIMRMQVGREEFVVLHGVKKVHRRVFCLASERLAAASDARDRALRGIIAGRQVVLSGCVVDLGRWNEGRMPERLGIGLGLREHGQMPEGVARTAQAQGWSLIGFELYVGKGKSMLPFLE